ncbi:MAG: hypothetical protein ACTSVI_13110 [Promethearchaeota archaeon]
MIVKKSKHRTFIGYTILLGVLYIFVTISGQFITPPFNSSHPL